MIALAIDTADLRGGLALVREGEVLASEQWIESKRHSEFVLPGLHRLLAINGLAVKSLGAVITTHGPGRLTGVRVGLSIAKTLCMALSVPLALVTRFEQQAASVSRQATGQDLAVILRTAHGVQGIQLFSSEAGKWRWATTSACMGPGDPVEALKAAFGNAPPHFAGAGARMLRESIRSVFPNAVVHEDEPSLRALIEVGMERLGRGETTDACEARPFELDPDSGLFSS